MQKPSHQGSNLPLLESGFLILFDALWATRSVTGAAAFLGQSQPAVSIQLAKMRQFIGDPLFVRSSEGMLPTPRAMALEAPVQHALRALRALSQPLAVFDPKHHSRLFRIAMTDASHITLLPKMLAPLRDLAPQIRLEAQSIDGATPSALRTGEADMAIGLIPGLESGFYQRALFPQDWVCLVSRTHPRLGTTISLTQYRREMHVAIASGTGASVLEAALKRHRVHRNVMLNLPGFLGLGAIVASTDLVATLPRQTGEALALAAHLKVCSPPFPIPGFTVKLHWHERFQQEPGHLWLRTQIAKLLGQ
jgi:DNA-binding transcriptional LysR family regulator